MDPMKDVIDLEPVRRDVKDGGWRASGGLKEEIVGEIGGYGRFKSVEGNFAD